MFDNEIASIPRNDEAICHCEEVRRGNLSNVFHIVCPLSLLAQCDS